MLLETFWLISVMQSLAGWMPRSLIPQSVKKKYDVNVGP